MLAFHSYAILLLKTNSGFQFRFPEKVKSFKNASPNITPLQPLHGWEYFERMLSPTES
jgi:hypothetical protein